MSANEREDGYLLRGITQKAMYTPSLNPLYRHNVFIEALPVMLEMKDAGNRMTREINYTEEQRSLSVYDRLDLVQNLSNFIVPLPVFLDIYQRFYRMIRNGYSARNPISAEHIKQMRSGFRNIDWIGKDPNKVPRLRSTAAGFTVLGPSGVGKSLTIESVLQLFPQIIVHVEYDSNAFDRTQIVWIKLECPKDGSTRGLCMSFFHAVDQLTGNTRYYEKYNNNKRYTANDLLPIMATIAATFGIGVIVIDEIQRLNLAKSGGAEEMLNFFVQLTNTVSVPVVMIGTFKALRFLNQDFSMARRSSGQGDLMWAPIVDDDIWDYFIERMWQLQWTKTATPLTPALSNRLRAESHGIIDIAVKIYQITQWNVIGRPDETISSELISEVAREHLQLVRIFFDALESKDLKRLMEIEDLYPPIGEMDKYLNAARSRVILEGNLNTVRNRRLAEDCKVPEKYSSITETLKGFLVFAEYDLKTAEACAVKALNRHAKDTNLKDVMRDALEFAAQSEQENKAKADETMNTKQAQKGKVVSISGDLREIVKKVEKGKTAYEALKDAGVIKNAHEFELLSASDNQ